MGGIHLSSALNSDCLVRFSAGAPVTVDILDREVFCSFVNSGSTSHKRTLDMSFFVYFILDVDATKSRTWSGNIHVYFPIPYFVLGNLHIMMLCLSCMWRFVFCAVCFIIVQCFTVYLCLSLSLLQLDGSAFHYLDLSGFPHLGVCQRQISSSCSFRGLT